MRTNATAAAKQLADLFLYCHSALEIMESERTRHIQSHLASLIEQSTNERIRLTQQLREIRVIFCISAQFPSAIEMRSISVE